MSETTKYMVGNVISSPNKPVVEKGVLKVQNGLIQDLTAYRDLKYKLPDDERTLHFGDYYILPGLIDPHCHLTLPGTETPSHQIMSNYTDEMLLLTAVDNARKALNSGITTLRDLGGKKELTFRFRKTLR